MRITEQTKLQHPMITVENQWSRNQLNALHIDEKTNVGKLPSLDYWADEEILASLPKLFIKYSRLS